MPLVKRTYSRSMDRTLESSRLSVLVRDFSVLWNWKYKRSCGNQAVLCHKHIRVRIDYERSVWLSPELVLRVKRARRKWPHQARNCCPRFLRLTSKERLPAVYIRIATLPFYVFFHLADLECTSYIFSETKTNDNFRSCKENLLV